MAGHRSLQPHPESLVEDRVQIPFLHCRLTLALLIREEVAFDVAGAGVGRGKDRRLGGDPSGASSLALGLP